MFNIFKTPTIVQELEQVINAQQRTIIQHAIHLAKAKSTYASAQAHLEELENQLDRYKNRVNLADGAQPVSLAQGGSIIHHLGA